MQALLRRHDADKCFFEKGDAVLTCAAAALNASKALVTASTGVLLPVAVLEASIAAVNAADCARVVAAHDACVDEHQARAEAATTCEAEGGLFLAGGRANEPTCVVER